jgi:enamine deaminase RidA (YjgF/YER057c/UK114 family)
MTSPTRPLPSNSQEIQITEDKIFYKGIEYNYTVKIGHRVMTQIAPEFQAVIKDILEKALADLNTEGEPLEDLSKVEIRTNDVSIKGRSYAHNQDLYNRFMDVVKKALQLPAPPITTSAPKPASTIATNAASRQTLESRPSTATKSHPKIEELEDEARALQVPSIPASVVTVTKSDPQYLHETDYETHDLSTNLDPEVEQARNEILKPKPNGDYVGISDVAIDRYVDSVRVSAPYPSPIAISSYCWCLEDPDSLEGGFNIESDKKLVDIFKISLVALKDKTQFFIPTNWHGSHYGLVQIDFDKSEITYLDSPLYHQRLEKLEVLKKDLAKRMEASGDPALKAKAEQLLTMSIQPLAVPQQENSYDCGIFVLEFINQLTKNMGNPLSLPKSYTPEQILGFRKKIASAID